MNFKKIVTLSIFLLSSLFAFGISKLEAAGETVEVVMTFSPQTNWSAGEATGFWVTNRTREEITLNYESISNATLEVYEVDVLIEQMSLTYTKVGNYLDFANASDSAWGGRVDLANSNYANGTDKFYIPFDIPVIDFYIKITFNMIISDTVNPVINGQTNYITNVNNPITEDTIRSGLYAIDNIDGLIPSTSFTLVSDDYTANKSTLGIYEVKYKVSDNAGNESMVIVKVHVVDVTKPIINGQNTYTIGYNQTQALTTVLNNLTVTDNYQSGIIPVLVEDNYTVNKAVKGSWTVKYKATDSSGNESDLFIVTINVVDTIKPVISGTNTYTRVYNNKLDLATIKAALTANDGYDGNITANITLKSDNYTANYDKKGSYQIVYSVKDSSNNVTDYTVTVNVVDTIKPIISGQAVYNTGSQVKITEATIRSALTAIDDYDGTLVIDLVSNGYTANYQEIRSHKIVYKATDTSGNFTEYVVTINVFDDVPPVIYTNDAFINIDGTLNYTLEQIIQHLINVGDLEASVNFENYYVMESDYNQSTPGEYEVVLMRAELASPQLKERVSVGIRVLESNPIPTDPINPTPTDPIISSNFVTYILITLISGLVLVAFINRKKR
ncbi:MAG: hypothetical protein QXM38_03540 [Candidatus Aenigmatarchaeota archaeon]